MDKNGNLDRWKVDFLKTYKRVVEYLEREGMDPEGLGEPFNWVMDLLETASRKFQIEEYRIKGTKEGEPTRRKAAKELKRGEFAGYPATERFSKIIRSKEEIAGYPYYEDEEQ